MSSLYQFILSIHALAGLAGLILFWIPALGRKGSPRHKAIGRWYLRAMQLAACLGLSLALLLFLDPLAVRGVADSLPVAQQSAFIELQSQRALFFMLLAILLIATTQRARAALVVRHHREKLRLPAQLWAPIALLFASLQVALIAVEQSSALFAVFAGIGLFSTTRLLWYAFKPQIQPGEWVIEHFTNIIISGITAHTAFLVFGANRLIGQVFEAQWALIPWLLPGIIGTLVINILSRQYRRRLPSGGKIR